MSIITVSLNDDWNFLFNVDRVWDSNGDLEKIIKVVVRIELVQELNESFSLISFVVFTLTGYGAGTTTGTLTGTLTGYGLSTGTVTVFVWTTGYG